MNNSGYIAGYMNKESFEIPGVADARDAVRTFRSSDIMEKDRLRFRDRARANEERRQAKLKEKWLGYPEMEGMSGLEQMEYAKKNKILGYGPQAPSPMDNVLQEHSRQTAKQLRTPRTQPVPHRRKPWPPKLKPPTAMMTAPTPKPPAPPIKQLPLPTQRR